ncbi:MAG TPA: hypothetical protein VM580_34150, partial [Labilithrix sp.]|nr:hypothetical protein [Labilithrix sp.]
PPPASTTPTAEQKSPGSIYYSPAATALPDGHGLIEVSAPSDAVVLVDGKERARGSAKVPVSAGNHDIRVRRASADERGCTIDVHTSRVAHVTF